MQAIFCGYKIDDELVFYVPINIIYDISRGCNGDNERLCEMKRHTDIV